MQEYTLYREGAVEFRLPVSNRVFYNPRARLARDLGVLAVRAEAEILERPVTVLELMAGMGLRGRRYLEEAPVGQILINDANTDAFGVLVESLHDDSRVELHNELAQRLLARLYLEDRRFDWIDLDPFGTPAPFFPWLLGVCRWNGLLYVTATDAPVLCGAQRAEALKTYDAVSSLGKECHEFGLRILLGFLQRRLIQGNMNAEPLFSVFDGYCWRALLRVGKGTRPLDPEQLGFIIQLPTGEYKTAYAGIPAPQREDLPWYSDTIRWMGPLWLGKLHRQEFVAAMFQAAREPHFDQARRMLAKLSQEADDLPVIYDLSIIADRLGKTVPRTQDAVDFLKRAGFRASIVHHNGRAVRTDAPLSVLLKAWG